MDAADSALRLIGSLAFLAVARWLILPQLRRGWRAVDKDWLVDRLYAGFKVGMALMLVAFLAVTCSESNSGSDGCFSDARWADC